jgi:heme a synthase
MTVEKTMLRQYQFIRQGAVVARCLSNNPSNRTVRIPSTVITTRTAVTTALQNHTSTKVMMRFSPHGGVSHAIMKMKRWSMIHNYQTISRTTTRHNNNNNRTMNFCHPRLLPRMSTIRWFQRPNTSVITTRWTAPTKNLIGRNNIQIRPSSTNIITPTTTMTTITSSNSYEWTGQWLLGVSGLVLAMISIGGITRLTQSGLSMTTWSICGSIPPITRHEWEVEFQRYQQYPEFQQRRSMTLSDFQYIYFWEYAHRMMGRFIGIMYVVPYTYLTMTKRIPVGYHPRMILLGGMGLGQGLIGWWMVQSGLGDDRRNDSKEIRVKPLRLATHLTMAVSTYSLLLYTAYDMFRYPIMTAAASTSTTTATTNSIAPITVAMKDLLRTLSRGSIAVMALTGITIVSGALVAGNDAGRAYNTFPKMNDEWFPSDYFGISTDNEDHDDDDAAGNNTNEKQSDRKIMSSSILHNFYENTATVQWNHRIFGMTTALSGLSLSMYGLYRIYPALLSSTSIMSPSSIMQSNHSLLSKSLLPHIRTGLVAIGLAVTAQFTLGVTTLLYYVPISLAAMHQLGSVVVLSSSIYLLHTVRTISKSSKRMVPPSVLTQTTIAGTNATTATNTAMTNPVLLRHLSSLTTTTKK